MKNDKSKDDKLPQNAAEVLDERSTKVTVHFPDEIGIELVQANELRHYELFQWLVALLAPIAVGFWTAYATVDPKPASLFWSAVIFSVMTLVFLLLAIYYRRKVFHGSIIKSIYLKDFK